MDVKAFRYRGTLQGHNADVRCVHNFVNSDKQDLLFTCSRDKTSRVWKENEITKKYTEVGCFLGHMKFVASIAVVPLNDSQLAICTGSNDKTINIYTTGNTSPVHVLSDHSDTVCCLATGDNGVLISGSWDKTARLWTLESKEGAGITGRCVYTMSGHEMAVWDVLYRSKDELVVTASADKNIRIFRSGSFVKLLAGHTDCVRGLAWLDGKEEFLSCSNDTSIKRWSVATGNVLETYYGHRNFVYSVAVLPGTSEFVSSSEDRTIRLWSTSKTGSIQTVAVPAQSPWSITSLQNGDVAVGCSDASIRLFTRHPDLMADTDQLDCYEVELSKCEIAKDASDLGSIDVKSLPERDSGLAVPGTRDGQTKMVKYGNVVEAYQWSQADDKWVKIGDVVGSKDDGAGSKTTYRGKEYDHVFSVDIEEGKPPLKLPYNLSEDAWMAAQRFIHDNNLPQAYLDQIANFIMDNTKGNQQINTASSQYRDPFTGSGGYIPGNGVSNTHLQGGTDPFTGAGRHIPTDSTNDSNMTSSAMQVQDPMIAPDRYVPGGNEARAGTVPSTSNHITNNLFPKDSYLLFHTRNIKAMLTKIEEFSTQSQSLSSDQLKKLTNLVDETHTTPSQDELDVMWQLIHWPPEYLFPALDLLRVFLAKHSPKTQHAMNYRDQGLDYLLDGDRFDEFMSIVVRGSCSEQKNNRLVALRCMCNLFGCNNTKFDDEILKSSEMLMSTFDEHFPQDDKSLQSMLASYYVNLAVLINRRKDESVRNSTIVRLAAYLQRQLHPEPCFRFLVAMGTLLSKGDDVTLACVQSLDLKAKLEPLKVANSVHPQKVVLCADHISRLL